jgi:hypothetical protein
MSEVPLCNGGGHASYAHYRGTSPIRNSALIGPCSRTVPRTLWRSWGRAQFFMSEVPPYLLTIELTIPPVASRLTHRRALEPA